MQTSQHAAAAAISCLAVQDPRKGMGVGNCVWNPETNRRWVPPGRPEPRSRPLGPAATLGPAFWPENLYQRPELGPRCAPTLCGFVRERSLAEEFLEWLEADLERANAPAQREAVPWIVMYAHKAFYMQPVRRARRTRPPCTGASLSALPFSLVPLFSHCLFCEPRAKGEQ